MTASARQEPPEPVDRLSVLISVKCRQTLTDKVLNPQIAKANAFLLVTLEALAMGPRYPIQDILECGRHGAVMLCGQASPPAPPSSVQGNRRRHVILAPEFRRRNLRFRPESGPADGGSRARYIGTQGELGIGWQATRNLNFRATYSLFKPGQFYRGDRTCQNRPLRSDSGGVQVLTRQPHGQC